MDNTTQKARIFAYCEEHGSITIREAFEKLHINSPSKRISEMRRSGYEVRSQEEAYTNDSGVLVRYKRYFIKKKVEADG